MHATQLMAERAQVERVNRLQWHQEQVYPSAFRPFAFPASLSLLCKIM